MTSHIEPKYNAAKNSSDGYKLAISEMRREFLKREKQNQIDLEEYLKTEGK